MQKRRFPVVPVIAIILKVLAVILFVLAIYVTFRQIGQAFASSPYMPAPKTFGAKFESLITAMLPIFLQVLPVAVISWGLGEIMMVLREIEFNGRIGKAEPALEAKIAEPAKVE